MDFLKKNHFHAKPSLYQRTKYTRSKFIKTLTFIILAWSITTLLFCLTNNVNNKSKLEVHSVSIPSTPPNPYDIDIQINRNHCGSKKCKFLFAYNIPGKEIAANDHFYSFVQLAEMLKRTLVLVNVQHSRLESCGKFPFNYYYDIEKIRKMFPNVKFITQQEFLNWTRERNNRPSSVHRYIKQEDNPLTLEKDYLDLEEECLNQFNLRFDKQRDLIINKTTINLGPKGIWRKKRNNAIITQKLIRLLDVNEEVLLVRHLISSSLFPSNKGRVSQLPYTRRLIETANNVSDKLKPFVAIHWKIGTVEPDMMPKCVESLIKYINQLKEDFGLSNIYLATESPQFPLNYIGEGQSLNSSIPEQPQDAIKLLNDTFKLNTWVSTEFLDVLYNEFPGYEEEITEYGIQGIFDKLIITNSNYFISGPEGCDYLSHKFSRKVGEARKLSMIDDKSILNGVSRWPLDES